jgi:hypothetical protein
MTNYDNYALQSKQVNPLPIGSGGGNTIKRQLNDLNTQLTMLKAQAIADTKYDPPVPTPLTRAVVVDGFCNIRTGTIEYTLFVIAGLCIVYGIIAK